MKKILITVIGVIAVLLGTAGFVYAQTPDPQGDGFLGWCMGGFRSGSSGEYGSRGANGQTGVLHDDVVEYFAEKLGASVDELNTRLSSGETMSQIAESYGLTYEEFRTLMTEARAAAIDQAVAGGTLTAEQGEWMKSRGIGMMGSAEGGRGMMGGASRGRGMMGGGYGDCPFGFGDTDD